MYYVALETPMMSSVIADCPDLAPQYFGHVYAYANSCGLGLAQGPYVAAILGFEPTSHS